MIIRPTTRLRGWRAALLLAAALVVPLLGTSRPATAQAVVVVNGQAITNSDIAQRTRLVQVMERRQPTRQDVVQELIDEKLKLAAAARYKVPVTDDEVDALVLQLARRNNMTPQQLGQQLSGMGASLGSLRARIQADQIWMSMVRGRFSSSARVTDKEVVDALAQRNAGKAEAYFEYQLRTITLVVPRGSGEGVVTQRRREAEALRGSFSDCETGAQQVRNLREAVIREPVVRTSADFPDAQRVILDQVPIGRLTPVEVTRQGIEMLAVCGRKEIPGQQPDKAGVREELISKKLGQFSQKWIEELRGQALIVYR
jgi:peptidyl-prolyl cis-trans isomerase SurA